MDRGEIAEQATPDEFFTSPKNERARQFLGQILATHTQTMTEAS
jgi:ABC-type polar amino acid transport system ATPase subunit